MRIMATNYIGNYSIGGDDGRIGRKYAILSTIAQSSNSQQVTATGKNSTFLAGHFALRNMPNRGTIHGLSSRGTGGVELQLSKTRKTKDAKR